MGAAIQNDGKVVVMGYADLGQDSFVTARFTNIAHSPPVDFSGSDGTSELIVYRDGAWKFYQYSNSSNYQNLWTGSRTGEVIAIPMDYDGGNGAEMTFFDNGAWIFFNDSGTKTRGIWIGATPGMIPALRDLDRDEDATVYRDGTWRFYNDSGGFLKGIWVQNVAGQYPLPILPVKPLLP